MATCLVAANSVPSDPQGQRPRVGKPARSPSQPSTVHRRPAGLCARAVVGEMGLLCRLCAPKDSLGHQGQPMKLLGSKPGR